VKFNVSNGLDAAERQNNWNNLFAEVIDETLKQVFKEDGAKVIYDFLENNSSLSLTDVSDKPEEFSASLEMLMVSAARVIEQLILKNLYSRLGLSFEEKAGYKFSDYIKELRGK
jgi:hypothetical protein